ncbi:hypothetical protein JCM11251_004042 [Rhodosporidiobolus azoricus]
MEKFSRWRDPSTGVQPFLYPLPASAEPLAPAIKILLTPFAALLGGLRTLVIVLLLGAQLVLVGGVLRVFSVVPPAYAALSRACNASIARLILAVIGVLWIKVETVQLKRTGRSPPNVPFTPKKGDIIVANHSSYIDLLYLAFRYNPTFLLPLSSPSTPGKISSFRRVSLIQAILSCGQLPQQPKPGQGESLQQALERANGPVVLFPEATTSNNRALLKFAEVAPLAGISSTAAKPTSARVFVLALKYPAPTRLSASLTYPIPSSLSLPLPLSHLYTLTSSPIAYTFSLRLLHASESPCLTLSAATGGNPKKEEWDALEGTLAGAARLKKVGGLGWVEKGAFLEFRRVKGR